MIKDIILNLERDTSRDTVRDFAISIAEAFTAHLTGAYLLLRRTFPQMLWAIYLPRAKPKRAVQLTALSWP